MASPPENLATPPDVLQGGENLPICVTCGTQFSEPRPTCPICDDPRHTVSMRGPEFTTLANLRTDHKNVIERVPGSDEIYSIFTTPPFAQSQRAILIITPEGNILWDCIPLLDDDTVNEIRKMGGIHSIVISSPRYYSTYLEWASAFNAEIILTTTDMAHCHRRPTVHHAFSTFGGVCDIFPGTRTLVIGIQTGGPYPGSLVLLWKSHLFISDTIVMTNAAVGNWKAAAGGQVRTNLAAIRVNSFAFLESTVNYMPLKRKAIRDILSRLDKFTPFTFAHGHRPGLDLQASNLWKRLYLSAGIQLEKMTGFRAISAAGERGSGFHEG